jgi:hypothetical protein
VGTSATARVGSEARQREGLLVNIGDTKTMIIKFLKSFFESKQKLRARIEFLEERLAQSEIRWVEQEKELDRLREDVKFLAPDCRERGCAASDVRKYL